MPQKKKTPFIVIEALDAGGSQTQTDRLAAHLKKVGKKVLQLHFPQEDRATGRLIYDKFLLYRNRKPFTAREQALLFIQDFFSRREDIAAALASQRIVVSDRFCTSTMAYQTVGVRGAARRAIIDWITWLCFEGKPALPQPDLVLFLDTPVAVSLRRLAGKRKDFHENREKLTKFRDSYVALAREQKWIVIQSVDHDQGERTREDMHQEIWKHVKKLLA